VGIEADTDSVTTHLLADVKLNAMNKLLTEDVNAFTIAVHRYVVLRSPISCAANPRTAYKRIAAKPFKHDPKDLIADEVKVRDQALTVYL
jgi:hypothetical protein